MSPRPDIGHNPARILIVDDEHQNRQLLEVMLEPEGFVLATAASGEEALTSTAQQPPDLILLDVMMPGIDGYEVAGRIKSALATQHIPIIMVTALDDRNSRMRGLNAGAEEFLTKPVDRAELSVRVKNLLRLKTYGEYYDKYSQLLEGEAVAAEQTRKDQMRFKDEFLSHVSHKLRSPLTAIKQFTSILAAGLAGRLDPEQLKYQQIVLKNIQQLQSMIDDLLEVTRLEAGKLIVESGRVSVSDAAVDAFQTLQETARAKAVTLSFEVAPDLPSACADRTRVRQILIILLDNAIKFTPLGGSVTLRVRLQEQDPQFLLLEVSDTGCGISRELGERIFERLYQVPGRSESSREGLGLGLYICKELVTRQGGTIWIDHQRQEGSTFSFTLPVFALENVIAPLLKDNEWPTESLALVMVEARRVDTSLSGESQEKWSREARGIIQRCVLPDLDVLLPSLSVDAQVERFFVAAFADDKGASVLTNRIREQFDRLPHLHAGRTLSVSYSMLQPCPRESGASVDRIVSLMTSHLEDSIQSLLNPSGDPS